MILKMDMSHSAFPTVNSLSPPNTLLLRRPNNADFNSVLSASLGSTTGFWNSPAHDPLVPGRVIASMDIPQGTMSLPIDPVSLMGNVDVQQISAGISFFGTLGLDKSSKEIWNQSCHWVRAIRLAEDCHSYNVQLKLQPSYRIYPNIRKKPLPKLIIQVVRPISSGQELQLWFSEDILGMLQVVFLTPSNIQGQEKYICLRCSALYESPNPLKLHITLACSKFPISSLWCRLADLMKESQSPQNVDIEGIPFDLKLSPDQQVARQKQALDLTTAGENQQGGQKQLYRPYIESAFKPFKRERPSLTRSPVIPDAHATPDLPTTWPNVFGSDIVQLHRNLMHSQLATPNQIPCTDDAQIESLVSSLGKAKQGHICLYCGKCYSRKYGLKIHIRTHTGYKPLKCKFCDRPFGDPSNLNKHVRLHAEGYTPYKCELCGKILVRRRDLERHLKSRHMMETHLSQDILSSNSPAASNDDSNSVNEETIEIQKSSEDVINLTSNIKKENNADDHSLTNIKSVEDDDNKNV